jgi:hypothetical protein
MNGLRWLLLSALALACSSSDEPAPEAPSSGGSGGTAPPVARAGAGGAADMPDSGVAPASAGSASLPGPECSRRQRRYFEERGFLAAGSVRGLLEALDEPEAFWAELPSCSSEP